MVASTKQAAARQRRGTTTKTTSPCASGSAAWLNPSRPRLERVLGAGGMGEVFLARDLTLDRLVAIKFLITPGDEHARRRLLSEARSAAAPNHPSICTIHEVVTDDACGDFIVMQYVGGETLAHRLGQGWLPATEALAIVSPLRDALAARCTDRA